MFDRRSSSSGTLKALEEGKNPIKFQTPGRGMFSAGDGSVPVVKFETSPDEMSRSVFYRRVNQINEDLIIANGGVLGRDNFIVHSAKNLPHHKRLV